MEWLGERSRGRVVRREAGRLGGRVHGWVACVGWWVSGCVYKRAGRSAAACVGAGAQAGWWVGGVAMG